jgi:hypothetical protein
MDITKDVETNERDLLKAEADQLGIEYKTNIPTDKLKELITAMQTKPVDETPEQIRTRVRNEAMKLVRVNITCMNPAKKDWEGEIFTAANSAIPTVRKFIPYNTPEGYHVPNIIYQMLLDKKFQTFVKSRTKAGIDVMTSKYVKEFAIEVMPPLSADELKELARSQAMREGTGE